MNRTDSGFDETFHLNASEIEPSATRKCNSTFTRRRKPKKALEELDPNHQTSTMTAVRPASENPQRKSAEPQHKPTTTTSSTNSAKSRRRGHHSLPSSRRTSCTIIDPSRPTRHYRINSSQTCPTANRDIDDVLALHFRSCSLFQSPTYQTSLSSPTMSGQGPSVKAEISAATQGPLSQASTHDSDSPNVNEKAAAKDEDEDTTMHWMSPSTRKTQYAKIDRANSGFRGFLRRAMPRCVSGPPPPRFYEEEKSHAGSVRRFRMDFSDEEDADAKSTSGLRMQRRRLERSTTTQKTGKKAKRFRCL